MIRFKITGADFLELKSGTEIQFQYNNSTLAIGNVKLSRSTEFLIPKTPHNERLLLFSSEIAGSGVMMRRKVQCEAHHSSGGYVKGYLSLKSYSKNEYSAIFVYGELEALKKTLEMGNISTYVLTTVKLTTSAGRATTSAQNASGVLLNNFDFYRYISDVPAAQRFATTINMSPTVKLRYLLAICAAATGINLDSSFNSDKINAIGILLKGKSRLAIKNILTVTGSPDYNEFSFSGTGSNAFDIYTKSLNYYQNGIANIVDVRVLKAKKNINVSFEDNYNDLVVAVNDTIKSNYENGVFSVLAGLNFTMNIGDTLLLASGLDFYMGTPITPFYELVNVDFYVSELQATDIVLNDSYYLQANLPEITFNDLLKTTAGIMLSGLGFDESTNTLSLFDFNYDKANSIELDGMLIEIESVDRTFLDYCRENEIRFKTEDYVSNDSSIVYSIDNANLSKKKTIYTIPLNDGIKSENGAYIKDFRYENGWKKTAKTDSLVIASKTGENLEHISRIYENFPTILNSKLKAIIENSTTVKVKLKMYLFQFLAINYRTTFKYHGIHYTVYEASFSGGIVSATLIVV